MAFMSLPLRQLHLRAHLHGLPHRHVLPHHVRFSFLFNFCSMCLQKSLLFPKIPLWHEIIPNAESNNIFCDLSKLRSNCEGDDANPFLWDTPTSLYMQHKIYKIFKIPVPTGKDSNKQCAKQMLLLAKIPCT